MEDFFSRRERRVRREYILRIGSEIVYDPFYPFF